MNVTVHNTIKQIDVYTEQNVRHYDIHIQGIKWRSSMIGGTLTTPQEMLDASPGFYYILDLIDTHPDFNEKQGVLIVYQNPTGKTYQAIVGDKIWLYKPSDGHYYPIEGGGGSSYGGIISTEQEMDTALPGKFYAFSLHESHSEFAASNGALFVMNSDEADGVIQVATVVISGAVKQYARSGEVNAYSAFAEISGGGSADIPVFPENTITSSALAQLPAGSNISGKNALEVLDLAINAELFPTLTAPSYTFTIEPSGLQEVGANINIVKTRTFSRGSINPQYQSTSPYRSGTLIDYTETGVEGAYTVLVDGQNWTSRANYNAGVQPKGSKGTNYQSPLAAGSTSVITRTITGVYPVYATTTNISIYTKLGLLAHGADIEVNEMVAETAGAKQSIRIPQAWGTISSLQQYNTLSGQWDNIDLSTFTKTAVQLTINGSTVNYWKYTHNGATIGSRRLKFRL